MSINSRDALLDSMKDKASTWGWGAITAFSRARVNNLIEQQFIESYSEGRYFPFFNAEFQLDKVYRDVKIVNLILGKPLLSFESADLNRSKVTVTLNIVGGSYSEIKRIPGEQPVLSSWHKIKETHGFYVRFELDLSVTRGDIDRVGRVTMNLSGADKFSTNLGSIGDINDRIIDLLKGHLNELPPHKKIYTLGVLDLSGYNPLTPVRFYIRTQRSPASTLNEAVDKGDGAVLVFIDLAGSMPGISWPGNDSDFNYFIPDDQTDQGEQYSAALVIHESLVSSANEDNMQLLTTLLFPGQHHFEVISEHTPHDRVFFGNLATSTTYYSVEPTFSTIRAGTQQAFSFRNSVGQEVPASWEVRSLNSAGSAGAGTIDKNGVYTAGTRQYVGQETLRVVVTGRYSHAGKDYKASALLLVAYEDVSISPRLSERQVGLNPADIVSGASKTALPVQWSNPEPIVLTASAAHDDKVTWTLLDTNYGSIQLEGNVALYTPPQPSELLGLGLVEQRIMAYNQTTKQQMFTSILLSWYQDVALDPPFKDNVAPLQAVQLTSSYTGPRQPVWSVLSGDGAVDENGLFTASGSEEPGVTVVHFSVDLGDGDFKSGYSVIETTGFEPTEMWTGITMTVVVADGKEPGDGVNEGTAYANGFQQIHLVVTLVTTNGELTPEEKDSLSVVMDGANHPLLCMDTNDNYGIPFGNPDIEWAYSTQNNIFRFVGDRPPAQPVAEGAQMLATETVDLYVVARPQDIETKTFYLRLIDRDGFKHDSKRDGDENLGKVRLSLLSPPILNPASYTFEKSRVYTEEGGNQDENGEYPHEFNYVTIDYWLLSYPPAPFFINEMVAIKRGLTQANISLSTLQFESNVLEETMASFTGQAIYLVNQSEPKLLEFDPRLTVLRPELKDLAIVPGYKPSPGQAVISLHRVDDFAYITRDKINRKDMYEPLNFHFTDYDGNFHGVTIMFDVETNPYSRNKLLLTTFLQDPVTGEVVKS
ncbi:hypothetical protein AQS70_03585 [Pseudomonas endophytica]|uniref:Uncharacterized protein n=1 Tax=Pseudomonas endophytica TaxID=1563157 RepID=A0A0Q0WY56_9PSED|nr:hypothetical protein [Pseudomonas endophytica]KQB52411.1 hypothetical protein AQS70_03585 [Pseudomonas endophytica]